MSQQTALWSTFAAYLFIVLGIGFVAWLRTRDASDYFLGGRALPPGVAALSAGASDMSGWMLLGLPGFAYTAGLEAGWIALGLFMGGVANWLLTARRLRIYTELLDDAVTVPIYLQRRFCDPGPWLRILASLFILLFFLFYIASGLIGGGKLFVATFGIEYRSAVLAGTSVIILYTAIGGFLAVSWTDVFQGLLMTTALIAVPVAVLSDPQSGGFATLDPLLLDPFHDKEGNALGFIGITSLLGWGLAYFGQVHILARFKAIRSPKAVSRAAGIGIVWTGIIYPASVLVGICGSIALGPDLADAEKVFMVLVSKMFHPLLAGFLLAAILAAIMSTVDSQLLVSSSALAEDIYPLISGKTLSSSARLKAGRIAVIVLAIIATALAMDENSQVLDVVAYAWGGLGAALGPAVLLSLYWSRMNRHGALAGVLVGGITVIVWRQLQGGWFELYELVPGFVFSVLAILIVSLLTAPPREQVSNDWNTMQRELNASRA